VTVFEGWPRFWIELVFDHAPVLSVAIVKVVDKKAS